MNVEQLINVLMKGITDGVIDGKTSVYIDPSEVAAMGPCVYEVNGVMIVNIGNGHRVVIS